MSFHQKSPPEFQYLAEAIETRMIDPSDRELVACLFAMLIVSVRHGWPYPPHVLLTRLGIDRMEPLVAAASDERREQDHTWAQSLSVEELLHGWCLSRSTGNPQPLAPTTGDEVAS